MLQRALIGTIASLILLAGAAQTQPGQAYFKFEITSRDDLARLTRIISIDNVYDNTVYAYATDKQFDHFKTLGYNSTFAGDLRNRVMGDSDRIEGEDIADYSDQFSWNIKA